MRITHRDVTVLRDLALSHVMSRDQLIKLGYFGSVSRVNSRLGELISVDMVKRLRTPFFGQSLYVTTKRAAEVVGERISPLIEGRSTSPRFIQHALTTTNVRIHLQERSNAEWRFEQQCWRRTVGKNSVEIRPDGLLMTQVPLFVEVDMGHVSPSKFKEKLRTYGVLAKSKQVFDLYGFSEFRLFVAVTGSLRARHLRQLQAQDAGFDLMVRTMEELGVASSPNWS